MAGDLHRISSSLSSILGKIDRGEGTLGGLVNDPSVYQSLQDIVAGLQKSRTGKMLMRHYGKKGAKEKEKEQEQEKRAPTPPVPPPPPNGIESPPPKPPDEPQSRQGSPLPKPSDGGE